MGKNAEVHPKGTDHGPCVVIRVERRRVFLQPLKPGKVLGELIRRLGLEEELLALSLLHARLLLCEAPAPPAPEPVLPQRLPATPIFGVFFSTTTSVSHNNRKYCFAAFVIYVVWKIRARDETTSFKIKLCGGKPLYVQ